MAGGAELACGHNNVLGFGHKLMMRLVDCGVNHKTESIISGAKFPIRSRFVDASFLSEPCLSAVGLRTTFTRIS